MYTRVCVWCLTSEWHCFPSLLFPHKYIVVTTSEFFCFLLLSIHVCSMAMHQRSCHGVKSCILGTHRYIDNVRMQRVGPK